MEINARYERLAKNDAQNSMTKMPKKLPDRMRQIKNKDDEETIDMQIWFNESDQKALD